jgi:nitrite reductase (NO-forming)
MATTAPDHLSPAPSAIGVADPSLRRLHGAAAVRVVFGLVWAIDASFKWLPGFVHGQTLDDELGKAATVHTPVIHQWIELWHSAATSAPGAFAVGTAVVETCIALGVVLGAFSNLVLVGSAVFSFGIWSAAEAFHLPWTKPGITDLGPSVAYIFAALALYYAHAGATWSVDAFLRPRLGRLGFLAAGLPAGPATQGD